MKSYEQLAIVLARFIFRTEKKVSKMCAKLEAGQPVIDELFWLRQELDVAVRYISRYIEPEHLETDS